MLAQLNCTIFGPGVAGRDDVSQALTLFVALYVAPAKFSGPVCLAVLRIVNHTRCGSYGSTLQS